MVDPPLAFTTILEGITETGEEANMPRKQQPCSDSECCKNTAKLVNMMAQLQQSVNEIKATSEKQVLTCAGNAGSIRRVEDIARDNAQEIQNLDEEMTDYKFQLKLLTNVVIRQDQQIAMLTSKINEAQQREMYPNLVISGIVERPNENPIKAYNSFVLNQLEIQELIPIHRAYRIGTGRARPMIVELRDPITHKAKIYKNAGKLKDKTNEHGNRFFISDHLPEEYNEQRRRTNDLIAENKKRETTKQFSMNARRGRLIIDEQVYEKAIHPPIPKEIMQPDQKSRELADEIDMVKGEENYTSKSKFLAYAAAVQDHNDIQAAYIKVRMKFADATHVVCAYRLAGDKSYKLQDYVDDGEFGAGRTILNLFKEEKLMNIVIFMVRYHGGQNLGQARFEIFKEVSYSAIRNLHQKIQDSKRQEEKEQQKKEQQHLAQMEQQKNNPAFPTNQEDQWSEIEENWDLASKKSD